MGEELCPQAIAIEYEGSRYWTEYCCSLFASQPLCNGHWVRGGWHGCEARTRPDARRRPRKQEAEDG